ncbi:MAG TPA: serine/threonine-protein kinase [Haliangiales bacterium]|nr:serine/threonine-protein kinase [Haliangiales bacterium]
MLGEQLGNYRILREIGVGGMGTVYLGQHLAIGRLAAVKVLLPELSGNPDMVARMFNEARLAASLRHPGLVEVYDFGQLADGRAYIVMEYLEGESLQAIVGRRGRLPIDLAVSLMRQTASALGAAHQKGIIHRDLKPENVFVVRDDEVAFGVRARILDFGVAKLVTEPRGGGLVTRTGSLLGTPVYMSPEQCRGAGALDWRTDIYSLGCVLFEAVTGRRLFYFEGVGEVIAAHMFAAVPRPSSIAAEIPTWLDDVILRMLAKRPDDRPQSMDEVAALLGQRPPALALAAATQAAPASPAITTHGRTAGEVSTANVGRRPRRSLTARVLVAATALAGVAGLAWMLWRGHGEPTPPPASGPPVEAVAAAPPAPAPKKPDPAPAPAPVPVPAPVPAPAPDPVPAPPPPITLTIKSQPPGAEVIRDSTGERLGVTPLQLDVPPDTGVVTLRLRLDGYAPRRVDLRPDKEREATVRLVRARGSRRAETLDPFSE